MELKKQNEEITTELSAEKNNRIPQNDIPHFNVNPDADDASVNPTPNASSSTPSKEDLSLKMFILRFKGQ